MKPPVFISHSSQDKSLAEAISAELTAKGFLPLVDFDEIEVAEEWRQKIHLMMARCRAAIVVLTKDALRSKWVLKEATILAWRRALNPDFKLVLALVGVDPKELRSPEYEPLALSEIQALVDKVGVADPAQIVAPLGLPASLTPSATILDRLEQSVREVLPTQNRTALVRVVTDLGLSIDWQPDGDEVACAIAAHIIRKGIAGLQEFFEAIGTHNLHGEWPWALLELLAPLWVPFEVACDLRHVAVAAINGHPDYFARTSEHVVRRAFWPDMIRPIGVLPSGESEPIEPALVRAASQIGPPKPAPIARRYLQQQAKNYCAVLPSGVPEGQIQDLLSKYPGLRLLVHSGEALVATPGAQLLRPGIPFDEEDAAYMAYDYVYSLIPEK